MDDGKKVVFWLFLKCSFNVNCPIPKRGGGGGEGRGGDSIDMLTSFSSMQWSPFPMHDAAMSAEEGGSESGGSECSVLHIKRDTGSGKREEMNYTYGAHVQGAP